MISHKGLPPMSMTLDPCQCHCEINPTMTQYFQVTLKPHVPEPQCMNTTVSLTTPTEANKFSSMGRLRPERTPRRLTRSHPDPKLWHTHMLHRPSLRHLETHGTPMKLPLSKGNQHTYRDYSSDVCIPVLGATSGIDLANQQRLPHPNQTLYSRDLDTRS